MTPRRPLHRFLTLLVLLIATGLLGGCSSFNKNASAEQAERLDAAMQRQQQLDQEKPATDNKLVYLDMIKTMQSRSLYFASLAHIDAYQKLHGTSPEIQRLQADALRATGQDDAAEKQYRQLLTTTEAAAAWHGLGLLAAQRNNYPDAIACLRESTKLDPINATVLSDLGYALMQNNDLDGARLPLIQAAELMPENRKVVSNLVLYLLLSGDRDKAEAMMVQAGIPPEARAEIIRHAQLRQQPMQQPAQDSPTTVEPQRTLASAAENNGVQLQLQWQLLAPEKKSRRTE